MKSITNFTKGFFEQSVLSGCIDIIVVQQPNGSLRSTPFHVRFGKLGGRDVVIDILINDNPTDVQMRTGRAGDAYFDNKSLNDSTTSDDGVSDSNVMSEDDASVYQVDKDKLDQFQQILNKGRPKKWGWPWGSQPKQAPIKKEQIVQVIPQNTTENPGLLNWILGRQVKKNPEKKLEIADDEPQQLTKSEVQSPRQSDIEISLCGMMVDKSKEQKILSFDQYRVTQTQFQKDWQKLITNKDLVIRIGDQLFTKDEWFAIILGKSAFGLDISVQKPDAKKLSSSSSSLLGSFFTKKVETKSRKSSEDLMDIPTKRRSHRCLKPNNEILEKLKLNEGANKITFKIKSKQRELIGTIYLYTQQTKFVISDIDGTITKSDILGQLLPKINIDWTHRGVAQLYQNIRKQGYQIIYLTARAIGQAYQTKEFIQNVKQSDLPLPRGPIITSPDCLLPAFKREVIDKCPESFKIQALMDIRNLFIGQTPFYAGFGNRATDAVSYIAVSVEETRIYIIDTESNIHIYKSEETRTYVDLNKDLNLCFPPIDEKSYLMNNFWKIQPNPSEFDQILYS